MFNKTLALSAVLASAASAAEWGFNFGSTGGKVRRSGYKSFGDGQSTKVVNPYDDRFHVENHGDFNGWDRSDKHYGQ